MLKRYNIPLFLTLTLVVVAYLAYEEMLGKYYLSVLMFMGVNIILATSLNLVNGYMGEFSCGHAGFMAVGAYVSSVLGVILFAKDKVFGAALLPPELAIYGFPIIIIIGGLAAALAGLVVALPSFKTRGDYLAIITIAANYIVISAIENMSTIGGARGFMGMKGVIRAMEGSLDLPWMPIWVFIFTIFSVWILRRFIFSTLGKGVSAICQDEIAAEIMSVNTNRMKMIAFMLSSGLAGIAGGLFAYILGYVNPGSFTILKSTEVLVMVYLGGMASLGGSVISAILFTIMLEALRPLQIIKWVVIPLVLIILMQFRSEGIMGNRELPSYFPRLRRLYAFKD
jgi:branched-chain amino acid transport system permease protein